MGKENEDKLTGYRCEECGRVGHTQPARCPRCKGTNFERIDLGRKAKLITYTVIRNPLPGFSGASSLVIGLLEFPNGVRAIGRMDASSHEEVEGGEKYAPYWGELGERDGEKISGLKFRSLRD